MWVVILVCFVAFVIVVRWLPERKKIRTLNKALARMENFNPLVSRAPSGQSTGIAIDPTSNRFVLTDSERLKVFSFSDLIAVEVMKNGTSISVTNRGSQAAGAAVGALLLGPVGLLLGGVTGSKRNIQKIEQLSLKIFTNDLVKPVYEIVFFSGKPLDPRSTLIKKASEELDTWHGRFRTILHGAHSERPAISHLE
ncbi:hypothetical protein [Rhizobium rhizogenes]|uniref:Uncharacterized protein n=1 Tax=Rhizobium rhizogenes NBRC 13257 TaxID=1220581 RepID=A0AA87QJE9_RHIRH|nr:hypothetical protein [Rhizobium rhizogenes]NTG60421.1 hypothetical protein [Rhizobium rhizogenes]NTG66971.1 hypothetical protein [Rhizobium rhizogenes]NTG79943.1 hypothetical protein [Rhizobium rhizogenes]NTH95624.1 hypothetical protein [Rhizobium rhizogenes]NTI67835.1 hypothetical protein [Rhizobium rhizogenes]